MVLKIGFFLSAVLVLAGCGGDDTFSVTGQIVAGPVCPVVKDPPDPECRPRPVEDAVLVVTSTDGNQVGRVTSDADGQFSLNLKPGVYELRGEPVEGLFGSDTVPLEVVDGPLEVTVTYDTGIR